ncbi:hypothetical protein DFH09DRAFT_1408296 [Mycena vulgaris]|nr:hypothetical protein DFH09DRAFT_1408296 [Mycena vulgaris]
MPNVRVVTWLSQEIDMAAPHLFLFPNITELHLTTTFPHIDSLSKMLGVCGRLKVLSLPEITIASDGRIGKSSPRSGLFDLTAPEEPVIHCIDPANYIADLFDRSTPLQLKSLTLGGPMSCDDPCSIAVIDKILNVAANSLESSMLDPGFGAQRLNMFQRLPLLTVTKSLTMWLMTGPAAEMLLKVWPTSPNVTDITFRIQFWEDTEEHFASDVERFHEIVDGFPWKNVFTDLLLIKFPQFQQLTFQLVAPTRSELHYDRSLRLDVADTLRAKFSSKAPLCFQWFKHGFDYKDHPIAYCLKNGFPIL